MAWWGWGGPPYWRGWHRGWGWGGPPYWYPYYYSPAQELAYLEAYAAWLEAELAAVRSRIAALKGAGTSP